MHVCVGVCARVRDDAGTVEHCENEFGNIWFVRMTDEGAAKEAVFKLQLKGQKARLKSENILRSYIGKEPVCVRVWVWVRACVLVACVCVRAWCDASPFASCPAPSLAPPPPPVITIFCSCHLPRCAVCCAMAVLWLRHF